MIIFKGFEYISMSCIRIHQESNQERDFPPLCSFLSISSPTLFTTYQTHLETVIIEEVGIQPTLWVGGKVLNLYCFSPQYPNVLLLPQFILLKYNLFSKNVKNTLLFKTVNHYTTNFLHLITVTASMTQF